MGHANAFGYIGGCSELVIPDNPKAVVTSASIYEPDLNPDFQHMAEFFGVAVIPARVRKPRDKAIVEAAVRVATMWIVAVLRNRTFFSLAELNNEIKRLLEKLNNRAFKKAPGSRKLLFESIEKQALKPLPINKYEYTHIGNARAGRDYHINIDGYRYSVPHEFAHEKLEYRMTSTALEVFLNGRRIASHARLWIKDKPSTLKEHMPSHHRYYLENFVEWTPEKLMTSASRVGGAVAQVVQNILNKNQHADQKFRACLGILRLARTWGNERLDSACHRAIALNACSFKHIKLILENSGDRRPLVTPSLQIARSHENVRGAEYYNQDNEENQNANTSNDGEPTIHEAVGNDPSTGISAANA
jgi:transposase